MSTMTTTTEQNIAQQTICISLEFGRIGNSKKVNTSQIEVDADKDLIGVSKRLLKSKELAAIAHHDAETAEWVKNRSVPSMFKRGIYLIKLSAVESIIDYLKQRRAERLSLIAAFLAVYNQQKADAEIHLRGVYNPNDYPPLSVVASRFIFEWRLVGFDTPGRLKEIKESIWAEERDKAAADFESVKENAKMLLRAQLKDLVDHLIERLQPGEDGKKKIFKGSTVTNIAEFLENFKIRDLSDDAEMDLLVANAQKILSGVDPKDIRENEAVRDNMAAGFGLVKNFLDQMVTVGGSRKLTLDECEEEEEDIFA